MGSRSRFAMAGWRLAACGLLVISYPGQASAKARHPAPAQKISLAGIGAEASAPLSLQAKSLTYRPGRCAARQCPATLELRGGVRLRAGKLSLEARRLTVALDRRGKPSAVTGAVVRLRVGAVRGAAERVELAAGPAGEAGLQVVLIGQARLELPGRGLRLAGARISLDTRTGAAAVQRARAELTFGEPAAGPRRGRR